MAHTDDPVPTELTLAEAADLLETSEALVEELIRGGRVRVRDVDGGRRLSRADLLDQWVRWQRARAHLREQADIVNDSPGGWDY